MIIGIEVAKLRTTPMWREHFEPALRRFPSAATHINPDCDVDPITDVDRLTLGQRGVGGPRITLVIDGGENQDSCRMWFQAADRSSAIRSDLV